MKKIQFNTNNYLELHLQENEDKRPIVLIAPGGGYTYASDREALPIANLVKSYGLHAGIIYYREDLLKYPDTIDEMALFTTHLRENQNELKLSGEIYLMGFSAGGHYAASYGVSQEKYGLNAKVDKLLLIYPVITGDTKYVHMGSAKALMGELNSEKLEDFSLEKKVTKDTPPTFIVHTYEDDYVVVENSILFENALRKHNVPVEMHLYQSGHHGLSLGTREVAKPSEAEEYEKRHKHFSTWAHLAMSWLVNK